jgi:hypothetical protein
MHVLVVGAGIVGSYEGDNEGSQARDQQSRALFFLRFYCRLV